MQANAALTRFNMNLPPPRRTLHEWYDFIEERGRQREWERSDWRTKQWWVRQSARRFLTAEPLRTWWVSAREMADTYAALIESWHGLTRSAQIRQMHRLYRRHGVTPEEYYSYKFYRPERYEKAGRFIRHDRHVRLIRFLIRETAGEKARPTKDKQRWYAWAKEHEIPTPRVIAFFEKGEVTAGDWNGDPATLPARDLFCKWTDLWQGEGAVRWMNTEGVYQHHEDYSLRLDRAQLMAWLRERSHQRPLLLQEHVTNHPKMRSLTSGGLATCRLITGRGGDGQILPILAVQKIPCGDAITDNISAGGLGASVNLQTGRLGAAMPKLPRPECEEFTHHPDTGCRIAGMELPLWPEVLELVAEAHRKLPDIHFIGWDITVSPEGPMIVEPNEGFGATSAEIPSSLPLMDTAYGSLFDLWMQRYLNPNESRFE